jgi:glycosyltransferase involved in cell wall biosynthesis
LVSEGKTGLLFEAGNVGELADAISFLHDHPQVAAEMGMAGRDLVRQRYAPQPHYEAMARIYKSLIESKEQAAKPIAAVKPRQQVRVAFIGGRGVISKYSGIESYYEEVGPRLAAMGHDVTVYCRNYFTPMYAEYRGMRLVRLPTIRSKHLETLVHTLLSTAHVLFSNCDVVHYHTLWAQLCFHSFRDWLERRL